MPDQHGMPTEAEHLEGRAPGAQEAYEQAIADAHAAGVYDRAVYSVTVERYGALGIAEAWDEHGPLHGRAELEAVIGRQLDTLGPLDRLDLRIHRHHASEESTR